MKLKRHVAVSESGVLFNAATGDSFSVNPVAGRIVELLKAGKDEDEIKAALLDEYDVTAENLETDFFDFVSHLKQLNLLDPNG
jgi:PqqD family protein of HPr-rel-A system